MRKHPEFPGDLVKIEDNPGFEKGLRGWTEGPKRFLLTADDGFKLELGDVGIVLSVWDCPLGESCFMASRWFCIFVANKGTAWFPLGWLLTLDSMSYAAWRAAQPTFGYSYGCGD